MQKEELITMLESVPEFETEGITYVGESKVKIKDITGLYITTPQYKVLDTGQIRAIIEALK